MKKSIEISPHIETLFGTRDENVRLLEDGLNINIDLRSDSIDLEGASRDVARAEQVFADYDHLQRSGYTFNNGDLGSMLRVVLADPKVTLRGLAEAGRQRAFGRRTVQPKSVNQRRYLEAIENHDMVFGVGPAGTGKTYLAVAMAISASAGEAREPDYSGASRSRSRRASGISARHFAGQDRSLPASVIRRALRSA